MQIMASDLAKLGMQMTQTVVPQSRIRDNEYRVTFPGLNATAQSIDIPGILAVAISEQCASADRRYIGSNRGCWKNGEYDRLYQVANTSLDPGERDAAEVGALRALTEDVGIIGLSYNTENVASRKGLVGPGPRWPSQVGNTWNVHEWYWQS
jgi:ABC-type transport system substrate-binding protein